MARAAVRLDGASVTTIVIFGEEGITPTLGAYTLTGLGLWWIRPASGWLSWSDICDARDSRPSAIALQSPFRQFLEIGAANLILYVRLEYRIEK